MKPSQPVDKLISTQGDLISLIIHARRVEITLPQPADIMYSAGNSLVWARHLCLAGGTAIAWRVLGIIAPLVRKNKKLATGDALVVGASGVPFGV